MPFFSFSINEIKSPLTKFNITSNKVYFSKNTELWKTLNKQNGAIINFLKREKRLPVINIRKKILFCLPPSIGLGDAFEYAMAIKIISEKSSFDKVAVAFSAEHSFVFKDFFNLEIVYPFIINNIEMNTFDTVFHLTLEIKSLVNQKYFRSNIYEEITNFFNVKSVKHAQIKTQKKDKVNKISIFPLSSSPIRTMPIKILNELIKVLKKEYAVEIFLDHTSSISKFIYDNIYIENIIISTINDFKGAARRLEVITKKDGFVAFRDFAHAPSKLKATQAGVVGSYPNRKVTAVFELHTFSSLNKDFLPQYVDSMNSVDYAIVYYDPAVVEHKRLPAISPKEVITAFNRANIEVITSVKILEERIKAIPTENHCVLLMSSGRFGGAELPF